MADIVHKVILGDEEQSKFVLDYDTGITNKSEIMMQIFPFENLEIQYKATENICSKIVAERGYSDGSIAAFNGQSFYDDIVGEFIYFSLYFGNFNTQTFSEKPLCSGIFCKFKNSPKYLAYPFSPKDEKFVSGVIHSIFNVCYFLKNGNEIFEVEERTVKVKEKGKSKKNKAKSKFTKKHYKVFTIKNKDEIERALHKKHTFTCDLWEVSGHWRTYKSGKTVFVRPYKKGKKRNENIALEIVHSILPENKEDLL